MLNTMDGQELDKAKDLVPARAGKKPGFHNQAMQKALGRSQMLEALTANKGKALGRKGLILKIMASLERDLDSSNPLIYQPARAEALKMALAMTKDDKAESGSLAELLKGGSNVQINFNSYFSQRSEPDQQAEGGCQQASPAGQGVIIGFTPPPRSGG